MKSPTYGEVTNDQMIAIIEKYTSDPSAQYSIRVGCDSQKFKTATKYVTVLTVVNVGHGGIYFYNIEWLKNMELRNKIYQEVAKSLDLAQDVLEYVKNSDKDNLIFETIEVDIGKNGPTKELIKEIKGWIESSFEGNAEIKGDGVVIACAVANRISK